MPGLGATWVSLSISLGFTFTDPFMCPVKILLALEYLQKHHIAHRDVRSDNLLLNKHGILKLSSSLSFVRHSWRILTDMTT